MSHYSNDRHFQGRPLMQAGGGGYGPPGNYGPPHAYDQQGEYGPPPHGYDQQGQYGNYQQQGGYPSTQYGLPPTNYQLPPTSYQQGGGYPVEGDNSMGGSGAQHEPTKNMSTTKSMGLVFFVAACCVMFVAIVAGISSLLDFNVLNFMFLSYLFVLGAVLAVLDIPLNESQTTADLKMYIGKYLNVLTRVTGKGFVFVFLGCALFTGVWNAHQQEINHVGKVMSIVLKAMAILCCLIPVVVGFVAIVVGVLKSLKLSRAQGKLKELHAQNAFVQRLDMWAQTYRGDRCALTPLEFNRLTEETASLNWEDADLTLIFGALVSNPAWRVSSAAAARQHAGGWQQADEAKIPRDDLINWVEGGMVWL